MENTCVHGKYGYGKHGYMKPAKFEHKRTIHTVTAQKFEYKCEMQFHVLIKLYHSLFLLVILSLLKILTCIFYGLCTLTCN